MIIYIIAFIVSVGSGIAVDSSIGTTEIPIVSFIFLIPFVALFLELPYYNAIGLFLILMVEPMVAYTIVTDVARKKQELDLIAKRDFAYRLASEIRDPLIERAWNELNFKVREKCHSREDIKKHLKRIEELRLQKEELEMYNI